MYTKPIEIEYDMGDRTTGPEVHEVDSLLFCVAEKLSAPKDMIKYLMAVFKKNAPVWSNRTWAEAVTRSINTQMLVLLEQDASVVEALLSYFELACDGLDIMRRDDEYLSAQELQTWVSSFAPQVGSLEQNQAIFNPIITNLVAKLSTKQSTASPKVVATLLALRIFFSCPATLDVLVHHPTWNTSQINGMGPLTIEETILGAALTVSCVHQPDTGIIGIPSSAVAPDTLTEIKSSLQSVSNSLTIIRSIVSGMITSLVASNETESNSSSSTSHSDALLMWVSNNVLNVPNKPHSTQYFLQWRHSIELQRKDGFYTNLISVMLRATQYAGEQLGSDPKERRASIDLDFMDHNSYGIVFRDRATLLESQALENNLSERTPSDMAQYRTPAHSKYNAYFLTTWNLIHSIYLPILERFRTVAEALSRVGTQERSLSANAQHGAAPGHADQLALIRRQLAIASSRMYSVHIALVQLFEPIANFFDATADYMINSLHIDLSDRSSADSMALYYSFKAQERAREEWKSEDRGEKHIAVDSASSSSDESPDAALLQLPAFMMESITTHYKWRLTESSHLPFVNQYDRFEPVPRLVIRLLTHLFANSHLRNPHLSKDAIDVFAELYKPISSDLKASARASFMSNVLDPKADIERMVNPLIRYYVGVEKGGPRAFYEKFPVRRLIGGLLRTPYAHGALMTACTDHGLFVPFIMVLLNDSLYLLDETMLKLKTIVDLQATVTRISSLPNRSNEDQQSLEEAEQSLHQSLETLRALSTFGNESMMLFEVLSSVSLQSLVKSIKQGALSASSSSASSSSTGLRSSQKSLPGSLQVPVILNDNLLEQLSVMLNYFLDQFTTPAKRKKLQLTGHDSLDRQGALAFNPRQILACLVLTYLNLDQMCAILFSCAPEAGIELDHFRKFIVSEDRSYNISIFEETLKIILEKGIPFTPTAMKALTLEWQGNEVERKSATNPNISSAVFANAREAIAAPAHELEHIDAGPYIVARLKRFMDLLSSSEKELKEFDIPEEDIPEQYLDAIMATLMRDPVRLPSGHIVDRNTIVRQLEGHDKSDPFTRIPMTVDQIVSEDQLKAEIEAWIKEKREALKRVS